MIELMECHPGDGPSESPSPVKVKSISRFNMMSKLTERHTLDGPSESPSCKQLSHVRRTIRSAVIMPPSFNLPRGVQERGLREPKLLATSEMKTPNLREKYRRLESDEGDDSSDDGSSSSSNEADSDEGSGDEATSSPVSIAEEVRIIDSESLEYLDIDGKYKLYCLGWMSCNAPEALRSDP
ncbi:hypothetical protein HAX54_044493 [Datura stramonium]|uniref:Uncharacterized protein n=1 Tax=Datura stramonium TaxID=4076 RepID=A0ABS8SP86_DATST|nr:hypothetical protein [Datura stramonium]